MKTKLILIFTLIIIGVACSSPNAKDNSSASATASSSNESLERQNGTVKMEFNITGLNAKGQTAQLIGIFLDKKFLADSAIIGDNGNFSFQGDLLQSKGFYYVVLPGEIAIKLLLDLDQEFVFNAEATNIDATAKIDGSETLTLFYDDLRTKVDLDRQYGPVAGKIARMKPSDPEFRTTYIQFKQLSQQFEDRNKILMSKYPDNFFTKFKVGGKNPELTFPALPDGELDVRKQTLDFRSHFWDDFDFNEPGLINTPAFSNKLNRFVTELTTQNQDSIIKMTDYLMQLAGKNDEYYKVISNWIALKYEPGKTKLMDGEAVYSHIILKYFTPERATWLDEVSIETLRKRASEMTQSLLNKKAGDVIAKGLDGKTYRLYDIKSPVTVVFIYNPDCEHCEVETPLLIDWYKKNKSRGVEVFSISANTTTEEWKGFRQRFNLPWIDIFDQTNASWYPKYFVDVTPELYVLDKDKKFFAKNLQVHQLDRIMERINK
jgi:thiol-disulfide isomerase/thioredoxin